MQGCRPLTDLCLQESVSVETQTQRGLRRPLQTLQELRVGDGVMGCYSPCALERGVPGSLITGTVSSSHLSVLDRGVILRTQEEQMSWEESGGHPDARRLSLGMADTQECNRSGGGDNARQHRLLHSSQKHDTSESG